MIKEDLIKYLKVGTYKITFQLYDYYVERTFQNNLEKTIMPQNFLYLKKNDNFYFCDKKIN